MKTLLALSALLFLGSPVSAQLWQDGINFDPVGGSATYNNGSHTQLNDYDTDRSYIHESTIRDNSTGALYDCDYIGTCTRR